jgi:VRR-NUC domain
MKRPEEALHRAVTQYLDLVSGHCETFWWCHYPAGGARTKAEGGVLKALGVKAGVPDIGLVSDGVAFFLELKSVSGALSPAQRETVARLQLHGARVGVARSLEEVDHLVADVWRLPMKLRPRLAGSAA